MSKFYYWNHFWVTFIDIWQLFTGHTVSGLYNQSEFGQKSFKSYLSLVHQTFLFPFPSKDLSLRRLVAWTIPGAKAGWVFRNRDFRFGGGRGGRLDGLSFDFRIRMNRNLAGRFISENFCFILDFRHFIFLELKKYLPSLASFKFIFGSSNKLMWKNIQLGT